MRQFPNILIPPEVQRIALSKPVAPKFNTSLPFVPQKQQPAPIQTQEAIALSLGLIVVVVVVTPMANMLGGILLIVGTAAIVLRVRVQFLTYKRRYQDYQITLQNYFTKLESYSQEEVKYQQALAIAHSPDRLVSFRQQQFQKFFAKLSLSDKAIALTENAKAIESSEKSIYGFGIELQNYLSGTIYQGVNLHISSINYDWQPVFAYVDPDTNAHIAIEIDSTSENVAVSIQNDLADRFLVNSGWIVIKFARSQVLQNPTECCKEFAKLLDRLSIDPVALAKFDDIGDLIPLKI